MSSDDEAKTDLPLSGAAKFLAKFNTPLADRLVAIIACMPYVLVLATHLRDRSLDIPLVALVGQMFLQILPMFVRRQAERVTPNPWYWLLAFVVTYWPFLSIWLAQSGDPLVNSGVTDALSLLSLAMAAWARLSLGRNIGFVPAQRKLVMRGAYRYMRHPIYTSIFLVYLAFVLSDWSLLNALRSAIGCLLFMLKSVVEERFLSADPEYRDYMQRVRWRWIPKIA